MTESQFPVGGEVDLATAADLQAKLMVLAAVTTDDLVLDCSDLAFIDSTGINVFAHIQRMLEVEGRGFRIVNMKAKVRRPFDILGLTGVLGIAIDESANHLRVPPRGCSRSALPPRGRP